MGIRSEPDVVPFKHVFDFRNVMLREDVFVHVSKTLPVSNEAAFSDPLLQEVVLLRLIDPRGIFTHNVRGSCADHFV